LAIDVVNDKPSLEVYPKNQNLMPNNANGLVKSPLSLYYDGGSGWIMARLQKLAADQRNMNICWLPMELRGYSFATHNERVIVIGSATAHQVTIIDLGPMLDMLHKLGVI
jgi:hypothetical protein